MGLLWTFVNCLGLGYFPMWFSDFRISRLLLLPMSLTTKTGYSMEIGKILVSFWDDQMLSRNIALVPLFAENKNKTKQNTTNEWILSPSKSFLCQSLPVEKLNESADNEFAKDRYCYYVVCNCFRCLYYACSPHLKPDVHHVYQSLL